MQSGRCKQPPQLPKRQVQIQGQRPPPLSVHKDSHKIKKPPLPAAAHQPQLPVASAAAADNRQQPVVIYAVSPKVVHATVSEFMSVVQSLTGISSGVFSGGRGGDMSPAARLAATERASPRDQPKEAACRGFENEGGPEEGRKGEVPAGILSPGPEMLPMVSAGMFWAGNEVMSPLLMGHSGFLTSPVFSSPPTAASPTLFSPDFFGHIWNF